MFKRQSTDSQIIFITLILVLILAVPTFRSLISNNKESEQAEQKINSKLQMATGRMPSSVAAETDLNISSTLHESARWDLNCDKKGSAAKNKQTVSGHVIQLQGKICVKNLKDSNISIVNKSNGFTASTFANGSNKYMTDFIQLQKGDNEIVIRYRESSGKNVEEIIHILSTQI